MRRVASALTWAVPVMVGEMMPADWSTHWYRAENRLPIRLSWIHSWSGASLPEAARQASLALVPVPQGERSQALPGQRTKLRE